jgi:hypothetical protein
MTQDQLEPADALALTQASRRRLTERELSPWWYAPLYGLGIGVMVGSLTAPKPWPLLFAPALIGLVLLYRFWAVRTGLSATGIRSGRTLWVTLGLVAVLLGLSFGGLRLRDAGYEWGFLATGVACALAAAAGSKLWDRVWIAELRASR